MSFLTAEWCNLALANYEVDPAILVKYLPNKTEPDIRNGTCYVSLVGFYVFEHKNNGTSITVSPGF